MKTRLLTILFGVGMLLAAPAHGQIAIIANPAVHATELSKEDVRDIFTGISFTLKGSGSITPVLMKQGPMHEEFLSLFIGKSDTVFRAGWRNFVFSGQGIMPRTFDSETAIVEYVARTPGAIGYISKSVPHDSVKVLNVR